jgi:hypothetical protein
MNYGYEEEGNLAVDETLAELASVGDYLLD